MPKPTISLVAAVARDGGIGHRGALLARLPGDLPRLKALTMGSPIVMGRKTFDSIGRPLPGRLNIVLTRDKGWSATGVTKASSIDDALALAEGAGRLFVIGGADIYALFLPIADVLELTEIDAEFPADTFFPVWNGADFMQTSRESRETAEGLRYSFVSYRRIESGE